MVATATRTPVIRQRDAKGRIVKGGVTHPAPAAPAPTSDELTSMADERARVRDSGFTPLRVWTAGPGMPSKRIYVEGLPHGLLPNRDGSYALNTPAKYEAAKRALGADWFPDDIPEGEPPARCDTCDWPCRSWRAMSKHLNQAHGKAQLG